ncbi:hypothetical protein K402DRAFT_399082 [Aulographum hederae CBS 113979]|uniref:Uncharacterized protein n=1 Tax=Aulographum hederae CBS 113979 TaxID=1176131 RepID=A0A6G1GJ18_9PEZI|nr:hypothetical protein K402DRAFT_399082 [Aulographum hederae CBS 113979]
MARARNVVFLAYAVQCCLRRFPLSPPQFGIFSTVCQGLMERVEKWRLKLGSGGSGSCGHATSTTNGHGQMSTSEAQTARPSPPLLVSPSLGRRLVAFSKRVR